MRIHADRLKDIISISESMIVKGHSTSVSSARTLYARSFFEKATHHARSIYVLSVRLKEHQESDLGGISALARSLIETHNVFLYLTEPNLDHAEQEFRFGLMHLNQATDLLQISEALGASNNDFMFWQQASRNSTIAELERNCVFLSFGEKQRTHLLRGKNPYLKDRYKGQRPISHQIESAAYNLFSHNVHSFGLSSSYAGSSTPAGYFNLLFLAVEMSTIYLAHLAKRYAAIRAKALGRLPAKHVKAIADVLSLEHFGAWQQYLRREDGGEG